MVRNCISINAKIKDFALLIIVDTAKMETKLWKSG